MIRTRVLVSVEPSADGAAIHPKLGADHLVREATLLELSDKRANNLTHILLVAEEMPCGVFPLLAASATRPDH